MLNFLLSQFSRSVGVVFRTIRAFVSRRTMGVVSSVRRLTNFSRNISKTATSSVQSIVSAAQKPTKREDYVEIGRLLVSKALIIRLLILLIAIGAFIYFVAWPFILGHFLTARFFVEDTRVETWSGRVIVYADKKKTLPMYEGRLTNGVLQGNGREYDNRGLLSYEGEFQGGARSGNGTAYAQGVMVYQGQFAEGEYQGNGTLYGLGGAKVYEGQFAAGLYDGTGKLYQAGTLIYEGQFSKGVPEGQGRRYVDNALFYAGNFHESLPDGEGVSYYPDGKVFYRGSFAAGVFEGNGTEYDEQGEIRYTGAFSGGTYEGNGSLYIAKGEHLDAEFQKGEPSGVVRWVRDGHLYYEGEWSADAPSGFGALYDKAGKQIYQGQFFGGTLDGRWLMTLSADDLRAAMGQAEQKNIPAGNAGFLIANAALGLRVLCSYRTENQDSAVLAAYVSGSDDGWTRLVPGAPHVPLGSADTDDAAWQEDAVSLTPPAGANLPAGRYDSRIAAFDSSRAMVLYRNAAAVAVVWERTGIAGASAGGSAAGTTPGASAGGSNSATASGTPADGGANAPETEMETFLAALDTMESGAGVAGISVRPTYGDKDPGEALTSCASAAEAVALTDALLSWWEQAEQQAALEENIARTDALLKEAQSALSMGTGSESAVTALAEKKAALSDAVEVCKAESKKAELRAPAGVDFTALDVPSMSVFFDPGAADVSRVALEAVGYAQMTGGDEAGAETDTKTALVDLAEAYRGAQAALSHYGDAAKNAQTAAQNYSLGSGSKAEWVDALSAQSDAKSAVTSALAGFSRQANALNALTGGWVSRSYGWHADAFGTLFEAEILPPEPLNVPGITGTDGSQTGTGDGSSGNADTGTGTGSSGNTDTGTGTGSSGDTGSGTNSGSPGNTGSGTNNSSSGDTGSGTNSGSSGNTGSGTNNSSSGNTGSGTNSGSSGSTDSGGTGTDSASDPDSDENIYGEPVVTDSGGTEKRNGPYIAEDGTVYPFDPEDEMLEQSQPDDSTDTSGTGEALIALLQTLFGISPKED